MQDGRRFILKIDAIKQEIENRHKRNLSNYTVALGKT